MGFDSKTGGRELLHSAFRIRLLCLDSKTCGANQFTEGNEENEGGRSPDSKTGVCKLFVAFVTFCKPLWLGSKTAGRQASAFRIPHSAFRIRLLCLGSKTGGGAN
jgi:hypothetical protein